MKISPKINFKNICNIHYSDNTVMVSSEDTSAQKVRENFEYEMQIIGRYQVI